jgi:2',3'-cyclic-nucleotide 2'-phosphodiesterase / 3'-nucleotidase
MAASGQGHDSIGAAGSLAAGITSLQDRLEDGEFGLRILATTDLHANLTGYDYFRDEPSDRIGLLRTAALIAAARAGAKTNLLLDNGDLLQGCPLGDLYAEPGCLPPGTAHPMIAAMNGLGYDAATVGNHDFNFGLDALLRALADAAFPFVLANVRRTTGGAELLRPFTILERTVFDGSGRARSLRIGITGFVPPQIMRWDRTLLRGRLAVSDAVSTARNLVPQMRAAGADIVVALNHSGIGGSDHRPGMENSAIPMAAVEGMDVQILGHSHLVFPLRTDGRDPAVDGHAGTVNGKPAVMAGALGSHLGVIDLCLRHDGNRWSVARHNVRALPVTAQTAPGDVPQQERLLASMTAEAAPAHAATLTYVRRPVGHTTARLHSYFSLLMLDRSLKLQADAQRDAATRFLRGGGLAAGIPILSAVAPLKSGGRAGPDHYSEIPPGPLLLRHCADLYPFPNFIRALQIDGRALAEWLERAAAMFLQVTPRRTDQPLRNPGHPSYNFDMIDGVTYRIDLSQPARYGREGDLIAPDARRITGLCHRGRPVAPDDLFVVVTSSYRAQGGGDFPGMDGAEVLMETPVTSRDILVRYLEQQDSVHPEPDPTWTFRPLPGTSVIFDTGPRAMTCLDDAAHLNLRPLGPTPDGYARFRLML